MKVRTLRFGELEIPDDKIITMSKPILGFENLKRYCLIERDDCEPFLWYQSIEEPAAAFAVDFMYDLRFQEQVHRLIDRGLGSAGFFHDIRDGPGLMGALGFDGAPDFHLCRCHVFGGIVTVVGGSRGRDGFPILIPQSFP